ncbi:MAG: HEAT repeat domain-containing protein, partial [Anaerolineae bacterium]|nr:HEAT repeat domain-containing protein [Anaerolineae bacterium]
MPTLDDLLPQLNDPNQRRMAIDALGKLGDPRAVEPLHTLMDSVIVEAAKFPRDMPGTAIPDTPEARAYFLISHFASAFAKLGEDGFPALLGMLAHEQPFVRADAAYGLGETRDARAFDPLVGALVDADKEVRISAAYALGKLGDPRAVEPLYAALDGADHRVCEAIFHAFNHLGAAGAERKLQALYHANSTVRGFAVAALATHDSATVLPLLIAALNDSERPVCWRAANELGRMGTAGYEALLTALNHPNPLARAAAVSALQRTSGDQSVEALLKLVDDPDGAVRAQVVQALRLESEMVQRRQQQTDTRFVGLFIAALGDADVEVRREASK